MSHDVFDFIDESVNTNISVECQTKKTYVCLVNCVYNNKCIDNGYREQNKSVFNGFDRSIVLINFENV